MVKVQSSVKTITCELYFLNVYLKPFPPWAQDLN